MWSASVVPATSSSRFTYPNYWRDPRSGNAFQIQVEFRSTACKAWTRWACPGDADRSTQPQLDQIATLKPGTMPGLIERYNGQRVVSLTANIHGVTLGEAAPPTEAGAWRSRRAARRGDRQVARTDSAAGSDHFRIANRSACWPSLLIFLLLAANFQSMRLALAILLTIPAVLCGVL